MANDQFIAMYQQSQYNELIHLPRGSQPRGPPGYRFLTNPLSVIPDSESAQRNVRVRVLKLTTVYTFVRCSIWTLVFL